jgi:cytochrome c556
MLFAIAGDYDADVRFKKDAPAARDVFARTAANSKVGTQQVFNEAKLRKQELSDMVGGTSPFAGKDAERKPTWNTVCDRSPLMQHLESIYEPRLKPAMASESQFKSKSDEIMQDAEMIAAIGQVMMQNGMEDADADDYKAFCNRLVKAGKDIVDGVKLKNFQAASAGSAEIGKVCTECHENYRS